MPGARWRRPRISATRRAMSPNAHAGAQSDAADSAASPLATARALIETEIEGLRAAQATDQAQINAVLARLEPLLEGAANMPGMPEGEEQ